jgi:hypothetical protein
LTLTNSSSSAIIGGSINSFVNGPLSKKISNGSSFQFPVGDTVSSSRKRIGYIVVSNQTTGTQIWTAQFFDQNPTTGGYNVSNVTGLQSVVNNEYWSIIGPSGGNANVTLTWDQYTGQSSVASVRACSRVAEWGTPVSLKWNSVGAVVTDNGQTSGTVATSTAISLDTHYFTIGAVNPSNLITSKGSGNWADASTWDLVRVPGQNDMVHISSGYTITLNTNTTVAQLIVDNGGTFNNGSSSYTLSLAGNLTLNGSWTGTGTGKISMTTEPGTIFGTGTMTGTSTLEIAGSTNIDTAASPTLTNVSILSGKTLTNNGTVTINNLVGADASSTFTNNPGSTFVFNGSDLSTLTLTANQCPNTVSYSGTVSQIVKQTTYCNITISGTGAKTISDGTSITAHGDVIQQSGTPFTVGVITFQIDGGLITGLGFVNNGDITINN